MDVDLSFKPQETTKAQFSLQEILNSEKAILLDTSIESSSQDNFGRETYELTILDRLNLGFLNENILYLERYQTALKHPNTHTIKDITQEQSQLVKIISEKIHYFRNHEKMRNHRNHKRDNESRRETILEKLSEFQQIAYDNQQISRNKEIDSKFDTKKYDALFNMIKLLSKTIGLKKDFGFLKGERDKDRSNDSDTDERAVAALYYLSLYSDNSPCVLSSDRDFISLTGVTSKLIGAEALLPYNQAFRKNSIKNPFRLYFQKRGERPYQIRVNSLNQAYPSEFCIRKRNQEENEQIKKQIIDNLKVLS